jgi:hypothetical protein
MSNSQSQQEVFKSDQYFWCHEGNENIADWVATNTQDHPHLYATYINDANAALYRKRMGKSVEHDKRTLAFLESYPLTFTEIVEQFTWYKTNILEKKNGVGPNMTGLVDVRTYGKSPLTIQNTKVHPANTTVGQEATSRSSLRLEISCTSRSSTLTPATTTGSSVARQVSSTPTRPSPSPRNRRLTSRARSVGPRWMRSVPLRKLPVLLGRLAV